MRNSKHLIGSGYSDTVVRRRRFPVVGKARGIWPLTERSRNKLGEAFVADVYAKWHKHGGAALERMIRDDPGGCH
jgi:hypothetical protein